MLKFRKFLLKQFSTEIFTLTPVELKDYIDFEVKRIYYITDFKGNTGAHCHKIEKELFVLIKGTITAVVDYGNGLEDIKLESNRENAIYVGAYVWHHFKDASEDAVLLAISSTNYSPDRSDYIEDYNEYKEAVTKL